jgi:hypothetical protein
MSVKPLKPIFELAPNENTDRYVVWGRIGNGENVNWYRISDRIDGKFYLSGRHVIIHPSHYYSSEDWEYNQRFENYAAWERDVHSFCMRLRLR